MSLLEVKGVTQVYDGVTIIEDVNFSVEKGEKDGRTYTRVERLDQKGRVEELARLIGGAALTPALVKSAEDLLQQAQEYHRTKSN